jgi:hypothetical protein
MLLPPEAIESFKIDGPRQPSGPADSPFSRADLHKLAAELDLDCENIASHYALAYSPDVDVREALKGYFCAADIDRVVRLYGEKGPRRLVLTVALLITVTVDADNEKAFEAAKPPTSMDEPHKNGTDLLFIAQEGKFHCNVAEVCELGPNQFRPDATCKVEIWRVRKFCRPETIDVTAAGKP